MKCPNDALFIKDDHEHYVGRGQAEAEDVAHLMAGETAAGALSTQRSWLVRLSASLYRRRHIANWKFNRRDDSSWPSQTLKRKVRFAMPSIASLPDYPRYEYV
jgi:hypothetical protein